MFDQREKVEMFSGPLPGLDPLRDHMELTRANTCSVCSYIAKSQHGLNLHGIRKHRWPRTQDYHHNARSQSTPYFQDAVRYTETSEHCAFRWRMNAPDSFASHSRATMPVPNSAHSLFASPDLYTPAHVSPSRQSSSDACRAPPRTSPLNSVTEEPKNFNARPTGIWNPAFLDAGPTNPALESAHRDPVQIEVSTPPAQIPIAFQSKISNSANSRLPRLALDQIRSGVVTDFSECKTTASNVLIHSEPMIHESSNAAHAQVPMFHARPGPVATTRGRKRSMKIKDLTNTVFKTIESGNDTHSDGINTAESAQTIHESRGCWPSETSAQMIHKENFQVSFEQMRSDSRNNRRLVGPALNEAVKIEPIAAEVTNGIDCSAAFTASVFKDEGTVERKATETLNSPFEHGCSEPVIEVEGDFPAQLQPVEAQAPISIVDCHTGRSPVPCIEREENSSATHGRMTSEEQRDPAPEIQAIRGKSTADVKDKTEAVAIKLGSRAHHVDAKALKENSETVTLRCESVRVPELPKLCAVFPEEVAKLPEVWPSSRRDVKLCLDNLMPYLLAFSVCEFKGVTNEVLCSHCSKSFTSFSKLREHLGLAMKFLPYRCTRCGFCSVLQRKASKHCSENHKTK